MYFKLSTAKAKMLKYVNILEVFVDPTKVAAFVSCDGSTCFQQITDIQSMLGCGHT